MTIQEAIEARHSVRVYKGEPLAADVVEVLEEKIKELNEKGHLHMQLIRNETKAFRTRSRAWCRSAMPMTIRQAGSGRVWKLLFLPQQLLINRNSSSSISLQGMENQHGCRPRGTSL